MNTEELNEFVNGSREYFNQGSYPPWCTGLSSVTAIPGCTDFSVHLFF